jgi:hypothetical protein
LKKKTYPDSDVGDLLVANIFKSGSIELAIQYSRRHSHIRRKHTYVQTIRSIKSREQNLVL